jgi:hypothetical protein
MGLADVLLEELDRLELQRLGQPAEAGLWLASLPWPRTRRLPLSLGGRPTFGQPLGRWPGEPEGTPRRQLLAAAAAGAAPERLRVGGSVAPTTPPPTAEFELHRRCPEPGFMWEQHRLRLRWGGRTIALLMGLRHAGEVHWWESCRLVVHEDTPECRVVEMAGAIPRIQYGMAEMQAYRSYHNPFLHKHNWLYGKLFARLHSNGVCEVFAQHVNSRFFDDGLDLEDVVPVVGLMVEDAAGGLGSLCGPWTGEVPALTLGGVRLDLSEAARLATPEQPGRLDLADDCLVWQPYEGVEVYSGSWARTITGDPFLCHAGQRLFPRGMARTLRFSLSLSERPPAVVRYLAPAWWYGACEEFMPQPLLPVSNAYDATLEECRDYVRRFQVQGGFEDGALPRGGNPQPAPEDRGRSEAGWEGEAPWAQFLLAWRTGDARDYEGALRAAYHFTDVAVDHADRLVRMHGFGQRAFAPPMNRVMACVAGWLETGDPYLIETAQAVVDTARWMQKNAWPRLAVGRDGKYVRSAALLYRYLGGEHYRHIAREGALMVAESQRPNGSFGDQAGGTGIHQIGAYITKPWMGLMATEGVLDYLELVPGDQRLLACIRQFADWLMQERLDHEGGKGWRYQHDFDGQRRYYDSYGGAWWELPGPGKAMWHQNSLARLLGFCSLQTGDPAYLDAWAESYAANPGASGDHGVATSAHPIPWLQAYLWGATLTETGVRLRPLHFGPRTPVEGTVLTPDGPVPVSWAPDGKVVAPPGVEVAGGPV